MHPGCGIQLTYKMIKDSGILAAKPEQKGEKKLPQVFVSPAAAAHFFEAANITQLADPSAAPIGSIVISDDLNAREHVSALQQAKNILYVCVNTSGKQISKQFGIGGWAATASVAYYDDFVNKLRKAASLPGRRFIEVLAPCPKIWHSEPANTVEIARQAVDIGFWPLFELDHGKFTLTHKITKLAGTDAFVGLQKLIVPDRAALEKSWRLTSLGKPFEAEM